MWESHIADEAATADSDIDPEGIKIAHAGDNDVETNFVSAISELEFRDRTSGK